MTQLLYRLMSVNQKQITLQAPTGALRVMSLSGTTTFRMPTGYVVSSPHMNYAISSEDYLQLSPLLKVSA